MRAFAALGICFLAGSALANPVSEYQAKVEKMADDALTPALEMHPQRWTKISMRYSFHIDRSGRIHDIRIVSAVPNRWVEDTVRHNLTLLKLPPVPDAVMRLTEMEGADAEAEFILAKTKSDYEKLVKDAHR
jgi:hypothetical protein